ncbi:hypothetical protein SEA_ZIKO_101 [Gordonia phage Ziko]|uniref:Uncharacterized protein n=1 Tax=Gordonia phage Ziko TaxID=2591193 RepID=A0A514A593_9CAUD|nr:hypothetical protein SEA_ZIKO_101 [Gordonia phage Ziko]
MAITRSKGRQWNTNLNLYGVQRVLLIYVVVNSATMNGKS